MGHQSPPLEATLLYAAAPEPDHQSLVAGVRSLIEAHGASPLYVEEIDRKFTLIACDTVQLLLAFTDQPMPIEHFLDTHRPATADLSEPAMLARLTGHRAAATVLVMDSDQVADAETELLKRNICWDVTEHVFKATAPDVVFWNETDTLFSDAEFERACLYLDQLAMLSAEQKDHHPSNIPVFFETDPMINMAALDWLESKDNASKDDPRDETPMGLAALDAVMSVALPNRLALKLDHIQNNLNKRRAFSGSTLAFTAATIGVTSLPNLAALLV